MKKTLFVIVSLLFSLNVYSSDMQKTRYQSVPMEKTTMLQKGENKLHCPICGMTLPMFYKTNHASKEGEVNYQYCSLNCLVTDKEAKGDALTDLKVVDNTSLKFIDAHKAFYVYGSNKPGTMTKISKYAFATKEAAENFIKDSGGELKSFDEIYAISLAEHKHK
ncbi:MAG: nitrous oxide reductase accessory protein NosL [Candidatus Marinarcus sp.]|uniref:nitrous oxide reductase accessory protein NosL n=1 Tax=Candidatus Marinarcus sp. TaxID=3100987 RepID=UPI003AFFCF36